MFIPGGSMLQCKEGQYNTIQYNNIHHIKQHTTIKKTQNKQNYQKNQEHALYTIKTQKRVEPKVDESVLTLKSLN